MFGLPVIPPWIIAAGAAAALASAFAGGWAVRGWRCDASLLKAEKAAHAEYAGQVERQTTAAVGYEDVRSALNTPGDETKVRTIYATREVPADCDVPADARGVLENARQRANAAAAGRSGSEVRAATGDAPAIP